MNLEAAWNTFVKIPLPWMESFGPDYWAKQQVGDPHGPDKYKQLQPESYEMLKWVCLLTPRYNSTLLDVGCNQGRHIKALNRRGYRQVWGVDVRRFSNPLIHVGRFEDWLPRFETRQFAVVFSFGMTLELVPPDFPICHHMARIAKKAVVLVVQEEGVPYPRLYRQEFAREGFVCTRRQYPCTPGSHASLFVFERQP